MKYVTTLLLCFGTFMVYSQLDVTQLRNRFTDPRKVLDFALERTRYQSIMKHFSKLDKENRNLDKLTGKVDFGFTGNSASANELFKVDGGVSLTKGTYPYELTVSTNFNVQVNNGKLQENLSDLNISYDRFLKLDKAPMLIEAFSFVHRRSNLFMDVNHRYEVGGGFIFAGWTPGGKLYMNSQGTLSGSDRELFLTYDGKIIVIDASNDEIRFDGVPNSEIGNMDQFTDEDAEQIQELRKRVMNGVRKKKAIYRIGLMVGAFYEAEGIEHSDSVYVDGTKQKQTHTFETTNRIRWELRPTFDFNLSKTYDVKLKIRPFFKLPLPLPEEWRVDRKGEKVIDARLEFPVMFTVGIAKRVNLSLEYTYYHDYAPNFFQLTELDPLGNVQYHEANREYHYMKFSVGYKFL